MTTSRLVLLVLALVTGSRPAHADLELNGWYACSSATFASDLPDGADGDSIAQCAIFKAPLCYEGVCKQPKGDDIDDTIEIFVKRLTPTVRSDKPNVFLMQGGPGAGSSAMESAMISLASNLYSQVNVYTMDHRGTGRSNKLECVAAQAETTGSPGGASFTPAEIANCASELEKRYGGDLAAFSVTSAAHDLDYFISNYLTDQETYVYGVSYGTAVVERLMHLNTSEISGFILDGIATTSGANVKDFEYFSTWDRDYDQVGARFLAQCAKNDEYCGQYFKDTTVEKQLKTLLTNVDDASFKCASVADAAMATFYSYDVGMYPPSEALRPMLAQLLADDTTRNFIPVISYRLSRCNADDQRIMNYFFTTLSSLFTEPSEDEVFTSSLLYNLIVYSEFWEAPAPTYDELYDRFTQTTISSGTYSDVETYCVFTKDSSSACDEYQENAAYDASPILYKRDKYWNVAASPGKASVLLMSSQLDPQTPHKYAETLLKAIKTDKKELVVFEHATHGVIWTTPLSDSSIAPVCGMAIFASFVSSGGDLEAMDKSCVDRMPAIDFQVREDLVRSWLATSDPYDGAYDESLAVVRDTDDDGKTTGQSSGTSSSGSSYKAVFIVFLVLFVVALMGVVVFAVKYRRAKAGAQADELTTPVEGESNV